MREMLESAISAGTDSEAAKTMAELQTDAFVLLLMTSALMAWMLKRRNVRSFAYTPFKDINTAETALSDQKSIYFHCF
mgnify:CR=1 FL=1